MSMIFVGSVAATWSAPHIYFIRFDEYLYIGETQRHPVTRWGQHFQLHGSFRLALASQGVFIDPTASVRFYAIEVAPLRSAFPEAQLKAATQAVEHEVHMLLRARPSFLGRTLRIISDTEKTAPRAFRHWHIAQSLAEAAVVALRGAFASAS